MINYREIGEEAFRNADKYKKGSINKEQLQELVAVVAKEYGVDPPAPDEIQTIINNYDDNGDGVMQLEEFMKFFADIFCVNGLSPIKKSRKTNALTDNQDLKQTNKILEKMRDRSPSDGKIFTAQNKSLRRRSIRMCRVSGILNSQMSKMEDEIILADIPKGVKDKKAWLENRKHANEHYKHYQQRLMHDRRYISSCQVLKDPLTNITTVVTDLQPSKRSSQDNTFIGNQHHYMSNQDSTAKNSRRHTKNVSEDFSMKIHKKSWEDKNNAIHSNRNISKYQSQEHINIPDEQDNIDYLEIIKTFKRPDQGFRSVYQSRNTSQGKIQQNKSKKAAHYAMKQKRMAKAQAMKKI